MTVSKRLRFEILTRDNDQCKKCGRTAPEVKLQVDHVIPVALGGGDVPENLQTLCADCNSGKSSVPPDAPAVADVAADAQRWADAMRTVAQERAQAEDDHQEVWGWFNMIWCGEAEAAGQINQWHPDGPEVPADWIDTVEQFLSLGLSRNAVNRLVRVAMNSKAHRSGKWKYFCGCCWTDIKKMQNRAAELISDTATTSTPLTTVWTQEEIDQTIAESEELVGDFDIIRWSCEHQIGTHTHCGDPVCAVQYAERIASAAMDWHSFISDIRRRDEAVMAEAEVDA